MNIVFASGGNDSVSLCQFMFEKNIKDIHVCYSNTKWASDEWQDRVNNFKKWVESKGAKFHEINSEGFVNLVKRKKAFPANGMAFCSYELKIKPAQEFLDLIDPNKEATCYVGVRREESQRRANWLEWIEESENHGGRSLCSPLVRHTEAERNELILKTPLDLLPYRSRECHPCVNANKSDIASLNENDILRIERIENEMGFTGQGKPITLFRPKKKKGATGIREVWQWSQTSNFIHGQDDMFCDSGFCGG